jgi:hypothetical protein
MTEALADRGVRDANRQDNSNAAVLGAADWLGFAAAPTFAIMALMTGVSGGGQMAMMCSTTQDASPLGGMAAMYLLMSAFHSAPWLKLCGRAFRISGR